MDFEKAFDSVYIPLLIVKLKKFNIDGPILRLINGFLVNRIVKLQINDFSGRYRKCRLFGLPQGSVLSPFLFILYISDYMLWDLSPEVRYNLNCTTNSLMMVA